LCLNNTVAVLNNTVAVLNIVGIALIWEPLLRDHFIEFATGINLTVIGFLTF